MSMTERYRRAEPSTLLGTVIMVILIVAAALVTIYFAWWEPSTRPMVTIRPGQLGFDSGRGRERSLEPNQPGAAPLKSQCFSAAPRAEVRCGCGEWDEHT